MPISSDLTYAHTHTHTHTYIYMYRCIHTYIHTYACTDVHLALIVEMNENAVQRWDRE